MGGLGCSAGWVFWWTVRGMGSRSWLAVGLGRDRFPAVGVLVLCTVLWSFYPLVVATVGLGLGVFGWMFWSYPLWLVAVFVGLRVRCPEVFRSGAVWSGGVRLLFTRDAGLAVLGDLSVLTYFWSLGFVDVSLVAALGPVNLVLFLFWRYRSSSGRYRRWLVVSGV